MSADGDGVTPEQMDAAIDGLRARMGERLLEIVAEATEHASQTFAAEDENRLAAEIPPERAMSVYGGAVTLAMIHQNIASYAASMARIGASPQEALDQIAENAREAVGEGFRIYHEMALEQNS